MKIFLLINLGEKERNKAKAAVLKEDIQLKVDDEAQESSSRNIYDGVKTIDSKGQSINQEMNISMYADLDKDDNLSKNSREELMEEFDKPPPLEYGRKCSVHHNHEVVGFNKHTRVYLCVECIRRDHLLKENYIIYPRCALAIREKIESAKKMSAFRQLQLRYTLTSLQERVKENK